MEGGNEKFPIFTDFVFSIFIFSFFNRFNKIYTYLVQSWVDRGQKNSTPNDTTKDFFVQPPIARVPSNSGLDIKIIYSGANIDINKDRETLFYINVAQIPPTAKNNNSSGQNMISFIVRHKMKLFFRPESIKNQVFSTKQISFYVKNNQLYVKNNSPFYTTFQSLKTNTGLNFNSDMVAPFSEKQLKAQSGKTNNISTFSWIEYNYVNDIGKFVTEKFYKK